MAKHIDALLHSQLVSLGGKIHLKLDLFGMAGEELQTCPILIALGRSYGRSEHVELDTGEFFSLRFLLNNYEYNNNFLMIF